jgi:hypothetical protein
LSESAIGQGKETAWIQNDNSGIARALMIAEYTRQKIDESEQTANSA